VAVPVVAIAIVLVVALGGLAYYFVFSPGGPPSSTTSTTTLIISPSGTTSESSTVRSTISPSSSTSSSASSNRTYAGTFTYINPLGPFGINDSSGKPVEWNSTQTASGAFTFSIDPTTYIGSGRGQGSITVATRGYCTGSVTVPYTFTITAVHPPGENFEISFNTPSPPSAMVQLVCQGSTVGFNQANNPIVFLSVYPNGWSVASFPATETLPPTTGISYTVTVAPTN
jgi:hypothetical protein